MAFIPNAHHFYQPVVSDEAVQAELTKLYDDYGWLPDDERMKRAKSRALVKAVVDQRERDEEQRVESVRRSLEKLAVHEAGHVVICEGLLGSGAVEAAGFNAELGIGETRLAVSGRAKHSVLRKLAVAGHAAEWRYFGTMPDAAKNDFTDDVDLFAKSWHKNDSFTRAFVTLAKKVKERFFEQPEVWRATLAVAKAISEAPGAWLVFQPERQRERENDQLVKSRIHSATGFERLIKSNEDFWRREGCL